MRNRIDPALNLVLFLLLTACGGFGHHSMFDNLPMLLREADWAAVKRAVLAD